MLSTRLPGLCYLFMSVSFPVSGQYGLSFNSLPPRFCSRLPFVIFLLDIMSGPFGCILDPEFLFIKIKKNILWVSLPDFHLKHASNTHLCYAFLFDRNKLTNFYTFIFFFLFFFYFVNKRVIVLHNTCNNVIP